MTFDPRGTASPCVDSLDGCACCRVSPGGNEVLGQVDVDRRSCDSDMAVTCPVQLAADLDLRAPDTCLISLILVPWRPMMEPISCRGNRGEEDRSVGVKHWRSRGNALRAEASINHLTEVELFVRAGSVMLMEEILIRALKKHYKP